MNYNYLIVSMDFSGSVLPESIITQLENKVLVVNKRNDIGGNAYDFYNKDEILIHKYGVYGFHKNLKEFKFT